LVGNRTLHSGRSAVRGRQRLMRQSAGQVGDMHHLFLSSMRSICIVICTKTAQWPGMFFHMLIVMARRSSMHRPETRDGPRRSPQLHTRSNLARIRSPWYGFAKQRIRLQIGWVCGLKARLGGPKRGIGG
jgi:hypothetical protein